MKENIAEILWKSVYDGKGTQEAQKDIEKTTDKAKTAGKETTKLGGALSKAFKIGSLAIAGKLIYDTTAKIVQATRKSADYIESLNLLEVAFNGNTKSIREFTGAYAETLNLDEKTLIDAAGHFKVLSQSMNMANETGEKFSKLLTQMTLDVSSLYNIDFDKAQTALQYAVEGRGTALKQRTGVSVLETTVQTTLDTLGVDAYVEDMNDTEKALARVIAMEYQLRNSQGDLARTIEAPANQFRVLGEQVAMVGRNIGNIFLPMIAAILPYVNAVLIVINKLLSALAKLFGYKPAKWDSYEEGVSTFDDLGSAIGGVGNAADSTKKKLQGLRGFDKLNVITTPTSGGGSGGGGGGAGGINPDLLKKFNEMFGKYNSMLDGIETKATRIANAILKWIENIKNFSLEANSVQLDSLKNSFKTIGESIMYIFSSEKLQTAAKGFIDSYINMWKTSISSFVTIGINIADGIFGGFSQFLDSHKDSIVDDLSRAFDIGTIFNNAIASISQSLATISFSFTGENFKGLVESVTTIFYEIKTNATLILGQIVGDWINNFAKVLSDNAPKIEETFDNIFGSINKFIEPMSKAISGIFDGFWDTYETSFKPAMDNMTEYISELVGFILDIYNKYISPVVDYISEKVGNLWTQYVQPIVTDVIGIIGEISLAVSEFYNTYLKPAIEWIIATVIPVLMPIIQQIATSVMAVLNPILSGIKMLIGTLRGVIQFLVGVFTGDWEKAWGGIKKIVNSVINFWVELFNNFVDTFSETFNNIATFFKNFVESIKLKIDILKQHFKDLVDKIKGFFSGMPDWFKQKFTDALNKIKNVFSPITEFFGGIWNKIKSKFSSIGTNIGNAIGGAFKTAVNAVLRTLENTLNTPIRAINSMIGVINKLPGVNIGKLSTFNLPRLAQGGMPDVGQMFIANEKGPELVGQIGGQSFVANQNQMMDLLDKKISSSGGLQNATFVIQVGNEEVARTVLRDLNSMARSNGKPITISG